MKTTENVSHEKGQNDILLSLGYAKAVVKSSNLHYKLYCNLKYRGVYI